jgi:hypothetical protein
VGTLTVTIQNVVLELATERGEFLAYAREFCLPQVIPDQECADVRVAFDYRRGLRRDHKIFRFRGQEHLDSIGYRASVGSARIDWNSIGGLPGLQLSHTREKSRHHYHAVYHEMEDDLLTWRLAKRVLNRKLLKDSQTETWDQLIEYLIYFPICWFLEFERGLRLLHASGVELQKGAAIFPGLSGVGKSTVSMYLFSKVGGRFLSDNLLLHDDKRVYACPEPILLASHGQRFLEQGDPRLIATETAFAHQRKAYYVREAYRSDEAKLSAVLFLVRSKNAFVRQLSQEHAISRIFDSNAIAGETQRYHGYSAMMHLLSPRGVLSLDRARTLAALLANVECYEVGIQEHHDLEGAMETTVLRVLERLASA